MTWDDLDQAARVGLNTAGWAERAPDRLAIISPHGDRSFADKILEHCRRELARDARARDHLGDVRVASERDVDEVAARCGGEQRERAEEGRESQTKRHAQIPFRENS